MIRAAAGLLAISSAWLYAEAIDVSDPGLISDGAKHFAQSCAVGYCHGSEGAAARGPALRSRAWDPHDLFRITAEGLPGTSMPGWKGVIPDTAIWAVTAYVLSLSTDPPSGSDAVITTGLAEEPAGPRTLSAQAVRGRDLFFDLTRQRRCGICHRIGALGTAVGPNLALAARSRSAEDLTRDILDPNRSIAFGFEQVELRLRSGETVRGVLAEETEVWVRVHDSAAVPPPLRSVRKADILGQAVVERSGMPDDLEETYSPGEVAQIVVYLREVAGEGP